MEPPPNDQNNNPHLRAQLKRDRDANERFRASQQEMSAKAARIQSQARQRRTPEPETKTRFYTDHGDDTWANLGIMPGQQGWDVNELDSVERHEAWDPGFDIVPGGDRLRTTDIRYVTNPRTSEETILGLIYGPSNFWTTALRK